MTVFNNSIPTSSVSSKWTLTASLENRQPPVFGTSSAKATSKSNVHLDTLRVPRASELVAERLRSLIVSGQAGVGSSLPSEKELVQQLGVSRATLREALRMLETDGLIATRPGPKGGIVVQRPGAANLTRSLSLLLQLEDTPFLSILEARRLLEPLCARLAAERASEVEVKQLQSYIETMRQSIGNVQNYVEAQLGFHLALIKAAHNNVLRLYTISVGQLISERTASLGLTETEQRIGLKAVETILTAVQNNKSSLAARLTESHLREFEAVLLEKMAGVNN